MTYVLEMKNIEKYFGIVHAIKNVSLSVYKGELIALVGENGAGKSTLMKILTGAYTMDHGTIELDGKAAKIADTNSAKQLGIGQVYQSAELVPELTVMENILFASKSFAQKGVIYWSKKYDEIQAFLDQYHFPIKARDKIEDLSVASRQFVAIAKVVYDQNRFIIFDEPTAVLSYNEVEILFELIDRLKKEGTTIIYISHRLEEIFRISDRIAVMRDGNLIEVMENKNLEKEDLISCMLGKKIEMLFPQKKQLKREKQALRIEGITTDKVRDVSFSLYYGEILGIAGLVGSGRTELARTIFGLDKIEKGNIYIDGKLVTIKSPKEALENGIFLAPEDRKGQGLVLSNSIRNNMTLSSMRKVFRAGWLQKRKEMTVAGQQMKALSIKAPSAETEVGDLSGGNQQKVIVAKAVITGPNILIFDEPTQGIDVGVKSEIYFLLEKLKNDNKAILFISSELGELQGMCSRIIVMRDGKKVGEVDRNLDDTEKVLNLMYKNEE